MAKRRWAKIRRGDTIELGGREWLVEKIKPGKKSAKVRVRSGKHGAESKVNLDDRVTLIRRASEVPRPAAPAKMKPTTPPQPATGDPWETQADRIERRLGEILGARLVGEAIDESAGYYVPPVDVSTIAAHLAIFHDVNPSAQRSEAEMLTLHAEQHRAAEAGDAELATNHWHTERRPTTSKKRKKS